MIRAALHGKLPSRLVEAEDVLTSNVFSFFKYADRTRYLKALLRLNQVSVSDEALRAAEFLFWPRYNDATEPDLVMIVGEYYILFEAKHLSDFGPESEGRKAQIERELEGGEAEALSLGKQFRFVAVTSHYNRPTLLLDHISYNGGKKLLWMNWQAVAGLLLDNLESPDDIPDREFVEDLYALLCTMRLRSFLPFYHLTVDLPTPPNTLFFSARSARYRGAFLGFKSMLGGATTVYASSGHLFYRRRFFRGLPHGVVGTTNFTLGGRRHVSKS